MLRKTLLIVTCTLVYITPCAGQETGNFTNTTSLQDLLVGGAGGNFFLWGGGELPVKDQKTRIETALTALKASLLLIDAYIQAALGGGPSNGATPELIAAQAEYGQAESILYGHYSPDLWTRTYKEDWKYLHNDWFEDYVLRQHIRLTTPMDTMWLLKMRQDQFAEDAARIDEIKRAIDGAEGRNQIEQASGAAMTEVAMQLLQQQQLTMTVANLQAAAIGGEVNEKTQTEAQQHVFITNRGESIPHPQFQDRGL